jgi:enamine deaminase RidA (YjgF/YER057c/UK114 family)
MLNLRYLPGPAAAPGTPPAPVEPEGHALLAAIAFGAGTHAPAGAGAVLALPGVAPFGAAAQLLEHWTTAGPLSIGRSGALRYTHDAELLFGAIQLNESAGADLEATDLEANSASAYRQVFALLDELAFPHLWRVWNFIPQINAEAAGLERYRRFNVARQDAFAAAGRATLAAVPAASAVGSAAGDLAIYFVAGRAAPLPVENPRQLSAYDYPPEYGPRSPLFARACLAPYVDGELLFISGTASIVGHRTLHVGDVRAQTRESLANIDAVLAAANARARHRQFARADLAYKVYVRHADDLAAIRRELEAWLPGAAAVYLQADICRAELLVEIEASAGHHIVAFPL